jgi:VanZ family protein
MTTTSSRPQTTAPVALRSGADAGSAQQGKTWLVGIVTTLIAYGSLYPFDFAPPAMPAAAWEAFASQLRMPRSLGDILGNVALFVPFGVAGVISLPVGGGAKRLVATLAAALLVAIALQAAQLYLPSRTAALGDVVWNMAGAAVGAGLARHLVSRLEGRWAAFASLPLMISVLWLAAELIPFVPSLDWQAIKQAGKPLARGDFSTVAMVSHAAGLIVAGEAIQRVLAGGRGLLGLAALTAVVVVGKVVVLTQHLDVSVLAGLALGWVVWVLLRTRSDVGRVSVIAPALVVAYAGAALAPFELASSPNAFSWIPFGDSLHGSMLLNARALATSALVFAGVAWLARDAGGSARGAGIGLAMLALILELAQIYIRGRSPGVTEPVIALVVGFMIHALPAERARPGRPGTPAGTPSVRAVLPRDASPPGWSGWSTAAVLASTGIAVAIMVVLRLPGVPYNVAELFRANGSFPALLVFALALLWTGAGPAIIANLVATDARRDWLLPVFAFGAGLVSLLLLWLSVTEESLSDIAGSSNVYWFVTKKDLWGSVMRAAFLALGSPGVVGFIERCVRYASLYGPMVTIATVMFLVLETRSGGVLSARRLAVWLVMGGAWLWLCKAIAFDWSSTDNLNELVAGSGFFGLGGGGYLYVLLVTMCANFVLLARAPPRPAWIAIALVVTVLLVPVGWWLLTHGLEPEVKKYGLVFSGTQFLLGPDRRHLLSEEVLFLRWTVVQLGAIAVAVAGARLALACPAMRRGAQNIRIAPKAG